MQDPEPLAELLGDAPCLLRRQQAALQQIGQGVPLDIFLQHGHIGILDANLIDLGQMGAEHGQQLPVDLAAAGKMPEDVASSALPVPHHGDTAPGALLQGTHRRIFLLYGLQEAAVNIHVPPLLFHLAFFGRKLYNVQEYYMG